MKLLIGALLLVVIVVTVNAILATNDRAAQKSQLKVVQGGNSA